MKINSYCNTSKFIDDGWTPQITGYDAEDSEYIFEIDLTKGALANWNDFKAEYPEAANRREFFAEFSLAKEETEYRRKTTR